jgi:hypothetical protein
VVWQAEPATMNIAFERIRGSCLDKDLKDRAYATIVDGQ